MPLFTDGTPSTMDTLRAYETSILSVANTEGIDLSEKLALAQQEVGVELTAFLLQREGSQPQALLATRPDLRKVVVTEPLCQWHTFHTLALVYRDAYNSQFNDRYLGKWEEYSRLATWASTRLFETGVGMANDAVVKAALPELSTIPGAQPAATYYVRVSWVSRTGVEGCPSEPAMLSTSDGSLLVVRAVDPPENAGAWNVYVGLSDRNVSLQNVAPLATGASWTEPDTGLRKGKQPGDGQAADYFLTVSRILQRG